MKFNMIWSDVGQLSCFISKRLYMLENPGKQFNVVPDFFDLRTSKHLNQQP